MTPFHCPFVLPTSLPSSASRPGPLTLICTVFPGLACFNGSVLGSVHIHPKLVPVFNCGPFLSLCPLALPTPPLSQRVPKPQRPARQNDVICAVDLAGPNYWAISGNAPHFPTGKHPPLYPSRLLLEILAKSTGLRNMSFLPVGLTPSRPIGAFQTPCKGGGVLSTGRGKY